MILTTREETRQMMIAEDKIAALAWDETTASQLLTILKIAIHCHDEALKEEGYLRQVQSPQVVVEVLPESRVQFVAALGRLPTSVVEDIGLRRETEEILRPFTADFRAEIMRRVGNCFRVKAQRHLAPA